MNQKYFINMNDHWYITMGINETMDVVHQSKLIELIERLKQTGITVDYLQVFRFSYDPEKRMMTVKHTQEEPDYEYTMQYNINPDLIKPFDEKVFVIDDIDHVTILLASEY